jgi:hypothetical protein
VAAAGKKARVPATATRQIEHRGRRSDQVRVAPDPG